MYYITRDGFTLLVMGYTGEKAMRFKEAYIKQFNAMEQVLISKLKERAKGIAVRQALTKALQQSKENERMHGHAYSTYTNCIYKVLFDKNASQLREKYGITSKENLRDCFTEEELKAVQSMEYLVSGLVDCGWGYEQIKNFIQNTNVKLIQKLSFHFSFYIVVYHITMYCIVISYTENYTKSFLLILKHFLFFASENIANSIFLIRFSSKNTLFSFYPLIFYSFNYIKYFILLKLLNNDITIFNNI